MFGGVVNTQPVYEMVSAACKGPVREAYWPGGSLAHSGWNEGPS